MTFSPLIIRSDPADAHAVPMWNYAFEPGARIFLGCLSAPRFVSVDFSFSTGLTPFLGSFIDIDP